MLKYMPQDGGFHRSPSYRHLLSAFSTASLLERVSTLPPPEAVSSM